jgi:predicted nucleic acid-binding protein
VTRAVLDASVAAKWFLPEPEPGAAAAAAALEQVVAGALRPVVPELFFYEILAVITRAVAEPSAAARAVALLSGFGFDRVPLDPALAARAEEIARRHRISGYDAAYAALAESIGCAWWTFDREAHARLAPLGVSRLLG